MKNKQKAMSVFILWNISSIIDLNNTISKYLYSLCLYTIVYICTQAPDVIGTPQLSFKYDNEK